MGWEISGVGRHFECDQHITIVAAAGFSHSLHSHVISENVSIPRSTPDFTSLFASSNFLTVSMYNPPETADTVSCTS